MPIRFPHQQEVPLANPPLLEVVCQIRFPPILRIAREEPGEFQEQVRARFPELEWQQGVQVQMPGPSSQGAPAAEFTPRTYRFKTVDEDVFISLAPDFFAVTDKGYAHWGDFAEDLRLTQQAVESVYNPAYAARVGLRYINRLTLDNTGSESADELFNLLRPEMTAMLRGEVWQDAGAMVTRLTFFDEASGGRLNFRSGYEEADDGPYILLDFDYFEEGKLPMQGMIERCEGYHDIIYRAFRWCLLDSTLQRFDPVEER